MSIIVVTARVTSGGGLPASTTFVSATSNQEQAAYGGEFYPEGQTGVEARVNVEVTNPANQAKAEEAARNVAEAIARIIIEAGKLPRNTPIPLPGGQTMTAGELSDLAKNVKFVVSDSLPPNPGVGAADRQTMTDTLYYGGFAGPSSYAAPGYAGQGMIGAMLHELVHLSVKGYDNLQKEFDKYNFEASHHIDAHFGWDSSDFFKDNESFAIDGAGLAGSAIGLSVDSYLSAMGATWGPFVGANQVYSDHKDLYGWDR